MYAQLLLPGSSDRAILYLFSRGSTSGIPGSPRPISTKLREVSPSAAPPPAGAANYDGGLARPSLIQ